MQTPWIFSSTFLPVAGESIDFMLGGRGQSIQGTFADGLFRSRWADYGADRVQSWRGSDPDFPATAIALPEVAPTGSLVASLMRIARQFGLRTKAAPAISSHRRRKSHALAAMAE